MTNREKFMEVMNTTFNAGFTVNNFDNGDGCGGSPCGLLRVDACARYTCKECKGWWDKEYKERTEQKRRVRHGTGNDSSA